LKVTTEIKVGFFAAASVIFLIFFITYFRLSKIHLNNYNIYTVNFKEISGLSKKADIKIAGVKIGWVEDIALINGGDIVDVKLCINPDVQIRYDAIVEIRQDGLLGSKFIDLNPGDNSLPILESGKKFNKFGKSAASVEDIIYRFKNVAENVQELTNNFKTSFGQDQQEMMALMIKNVYEASNKIATFSDVLIQNQNNINLIVNDLRNFTESIPLISNDFRKLTQKLDSNVLPAFQESMEKISDVFDRDFSTVSNNINSIASKINQGQGLIGKIINDERIYDDVCASTNKIRTFLDSADKIAIVNDSHFESMFRPGEDYEYKDSKGYLGFRFHTSEDQYYLLQFVGSQRGTIIRNDIYANYADEFGRPYSLQDLTEIGAASEGAFRVLLPQSKINVFRRDSTKYSFQFAKIFDNLASRIGLFENSFGMAIDYELPLHSDYIRWITTFEAFDFHGQSRIDDRRPHLKWLNRLFFLKNIYMSFGIDDFVSKHNTNAFFGIGVRFVDDDIKYIIGKIGLFSGTGLFTS
jgi:phospholipid/cholesterol/gamma-HCH transport system substrate-binding protein